MSATGCGVLWAAVVVAAAAHARRRRLPARLAALVTGGSPPPALGAGGSSPLVLGADGSSPLALGVPARPRAGPRTPLRVAAIVVLGVALVAVWPPLVVAAATGVLIARRWRHVRRRAAARASVIGGLPEVIDLVALAADAGFTVALIVQQLARRAPPPFAAAFAGAVQRTDRGQRLADALAAMPDQLGDPVRPLIGALVATERYGVPLAPALEHLAYDARRERRRRAEVAARRLPVRLCFPLVGCTLPGFVLLTIAPLLAGALRSLRL